MEYIKELKVRFEEKIKLNNKFINSDYRYKKGDIWYCDLGINIGNEFNKVRPVLIITNNKFSRGNNLIAIPITSLKSEKNILNTDIIINTDFNKKQESIIRLNHLKDISKKRLIKKVGRIDDGRLKELDEKLKLLFDIRQ